VKQKDVKTLRKEMSADFVEHLTDVLNRVAKSTRQAEQMFWHLKPEFRDK
jgi:hypothetical protein